MSRNNTLFVHTEGKGDPVIFLHGVMSTHRYWRDVNAALKNEPLQLIQPDLLGFGNSPKPRNSSYAIDEHIDMLERSIDLQKGPFILVGHSMGAVIALLWANQRPELFTRVVLTSLVFLKEDTIHSQVSSLLHGKAPLKSKRLSRLVVRSLAWLAWVPAKIVTVIPHRLPKHVTEDMVRHSARALKRTFRQAIYHERVAVELGILSVPTVIIQSSTDAMVRDGFEELQIIMKNNTHITLKTIKTSHQIPLDDPRLVADTILRL